MGNLLLTQAAPARNVAEQTGKTNKSEQKENYTRKQEGKHTTPNILISDFRITANNTGKKTD